VNRYILIRRLRWPVILVLVGVIALLHQTGLIDDFWHLFWPLLLISIGVMLLAERAALAAAETEPPAPYAGQPYAAAPNYGGAPVAGQTPAPQSTAIVPTETNDIEKYNEGGQS
jgi:hypothetical protein